MASPPPLPKKRGRKIVLIILALLAIPILMAAGWRWNLKRDVNTRLEAIRAAGLPTSGAELNDFYPSVLDEENAALIITQAFALMTNYPDARSNEVKNFKLPSPREPLTSEQKDLLSGYVEMNRPALAKAQEGLSRPKSRYPIDMTDGLNVPLPHLGRLNHLAETAFFDGVLASDSGQKAEAVRSIVAILELSQTLAAEPLLISQIVRLRMHTLAKEILERCLNSSDLNEQQMSLLEEAFGEASHTNGMLLAMIGERAAAIPYFRMSLAEFEQIAGSPDASTGERLGLVLLSLLLQVTGSSERDLRFYLDVMETSVALAGIEPPQSLAITNVQEDVFAEIKRQRYLRSAQILPGMSKAFIREAESHANLSLAQTALAVERFQITQGRVPSELSELIPDYLPEIPLDPFDGAPLKFEKLSTGYAIWSVGEDGRDDGGKPKPSETSQRRGAENHDLTFIVEG